MAHEHPSGLPKTYDRAASGHMPLAARMVVPEGRFVAGANINEAQRIIERRGRRVADLTASDGDRITGAGILVDTEAETVTLAAGKIFVAGDVRDVAAAVLEAVPMTGTTTVGIRLVTTTVDHDDDPVMKGIGPGIWAEGDACAARQDEAIAWALPGDGGDGDYYPVYTLVDGVVLDQTGPTVLTGINEQIARYDYDAHGSYIVDGCDVVALGKLGSAQIFSVSSGVANIRGNKRTRETALRHVETEAPDLETITAESHTVTADPMVIETNRPAIAAVTTVVVVKQVVETVVRGAVPGSADELAHASVTSIVSVTQGATTYVAATDFLLSGDSVSWAPGGAEPAGSSTYTVTYRYHEVVTPTAVTATTVTVAGAVIGEAAQLTYTSKIPRIDLLCLAADGTTAYVKGIAARKGRLPPATPTQLLKLAEVHNDWLGTPVIKNNGPNSVPYTELGRRIRQLETVISQLSRNRLSTGVVDRVSAREVFTDDFQDDSLRDQGEAQTAAIIGGTLQLAVDLVSTHRYLTAPVTLDGTEEIVVAQTLRTSASKINPYANLTRMAAGMTLTPAVDYWTEMETVWTSGVTNQFGGTGQVVGTTTLTEVVSETLVDAATLREITVDFAIEGFGVGEILESLTFDGVDITPDPALVAGSSGQITGTLTIPAGIPAGARLVRAEGAAGSFATATFIGNGQIEVDVMRQVTLVTRATIQVVTVGGGGGGESSGTNNNAGGGVDPLAQSFALQDGRHIVGVNFWLAAIGDPTRVIRVRIVEMLAGFPTTDVVAEAVVDVSAAEVGDKLEARFACPVYLSADRLWSIVWMTDDPDHEISIAQQGDVFTDPVTGEQTFVASQPYTVGDMFSGSNSVSWVVHPRADVAFELVAARFNPTTKLVTLGTIALSTISDILVRASVEEPTAAAKCVFEIVRASGAVVQLIAGQTVPFDDFISETVTLRARLTGSATVSPTLWPGVMAALGRLRTTGTYVSKVWPFGSAVDVKALFAALLPSGSSVAVACDKADDTWMAMTVADTSQLDGGWVEPVYVKTGVTAAEGRVRLTLSGSPASRPTVAELRSYPW